jgi:hypothetical protein
MQLLYFTFGCYYTYLPVDGHVVKEILSVCICRCVKKCDLVHRENLSVEGVYLWFIQ